MNKLKGVFGKKERQNTNNKERPKSAARGQDKEAKLLRSNKKKEQNKELSATQTEIKKPRRASEHFQIFEEEDRGGKAEHDSLGIKKQNLDPLGSVDNKARFRSNSQNSIHQFQQGGSAKNKSFNESLLDQYEEAEVFEELSPSEGNKSFEETKSFKDDDAANDR